MTLSSKGGLTTVYPYLSWRSQTSMVAGTLRGDAIVPRRSGARELGETGASGRQDERGRRCQVIDDEVDGFVGHGLAGAVSRLN